MADRQNYNDYGQYVTVCGGNYYQGSGASSLVRHCSAVGCCYVCCLRCTGGCTVCHFVGDGIPLFLNMSLKIGFFLRL